MRLYRAVQKYVESNSGKLVVVGGIQIIQWPGDSDTKFTVGIRCTGVKPTFAVPPDFKTSDTQKGE